MDTFGRHVNLLKFIGELIGDCINSIREETNGLRIRARNGLRIRARARISAAAQSGLNEIRTHSSQQVPGKRKLNVDPRPTSLSTKIWPP